MNRLIGKENINFGLLGTIPKNYIGSSGFSLKSINESGNWMGFLPIGEQQFSIYFDTLGCVTFGCINVLEILAKYSLKIDLNISDRFTAKDSGTTNQGNWVYKVADSLIEKSFILEEDYGYPRNQRTPVFTREEYFKELIPELYELAEQNKQKYNINYRFVHKDIFKEMLKVSPIAVSVRAWFDDNGDKIYENQTDKHNHLVVLVAYDDQDRPIIYDSYPDVDTNALQYTESKYYLKTLEKDYNFGDYGTVFNIKKINMSNVKILKNEDSSEIIIGLPVREDFAMMSYLDNAGIDYVVKSDGSLDWDSIKINGTFKIN